MDDSLTPTGQNSDLRSTKTLGDCLEILPTLPRVDAVITDPPYGIGYVHSGGGGCQELS